LFEGLIDAPSLNEPEGIPYFIAEVTTLFAKAFIKGKVVAGRGGEGIAGLTMGIRNAKPATLKIGGKAVDPLALYWLVSNDYCANGGDQMSMLADPVQRINTKMKIRDVLIQSLADRYKKDGIITVIEDGRIYNEQ